MNITPTIDDVADLVRLLALTTRPANPDRPGSNLVEPGLLAQLRANIVPDGAGAAGNRKQASHRTPFNAAALDLYTHLERVVRETFIQGTDKPATGSPEEQLVTWYVELAVDYSAGDVTPTQLEHQYDQLDGWRTKIMDHFNPPERGDLPFPCPRCNWTWMTFHRPEGDIRQHALVRIVRPWRSEVAVRCRKCGAEWAGEEQLIELAADLGIPAGTLTDTAPEPEPDPIDLAPLYVCVMSREQTAQYARDNDLPADRVAHAANGIGKVRRTHRPIIIVRHDAYAPGPHEQARVDETLRITTLVNTENGHALAEETAGA